MMDNSGSDGIQCNPSGVPPDAQVVISHMTASGGYPEVAKGKHNGSVYISDTSLLGVLSAMGIEPVSRSPIMADWRAWWEFPVEDGEAVMRVAKAFYTQFDGDPSKPSFLRVADERRRAFMLRATAGKGMKARQKLESE